MSIQTAIENAQQKVENAYTAVQNKGGTMPATQNLSNLPTAINSISTAGAVEELNVTPTTSQQTITPSAGVDGFNPVKVAAVTSDIDSDIQAGNIKSGVNILGVNGTVVELNGETKSVSLTNANGQTFTPSSNKNAITSITVTPNNQNRTVTPTTSQQTLTVNSGYSGNGTVTVNAVTSAIDNNIQPENIKKDVVILGTTGTYEGSGGVGIKREVSAQGVYQMPTSSFTFALPSNATDVGSYALYYAFSGCTGLTTVDLSSLTTVSGSYALQQAFNGCTGLTSLDLSSLTTVSGSYALQQAFNGCTGLTTVDLSSLTTVSGSNTLYRAFSDCTDLTTVDLSSLTTVSGSYTLYYAFSDCTGLTTVDLSSLTTVSGNNIMQYAFSDCTGISNINFNNLQTIGANRSASNFGQFSLCFTNCNNLTSITFPKLEKIYCTGGTAAAYGTFYNNNKVQKMYFPKLDTITYGTGASSSNQGACRYVFSNCTSLTELHFGAANQSAIEASPGYSTAWGRGAGNVTIYFDL